MAKVMNGRYTAHRDEPFVVFLIGMRINQLWAIHKWLPTMIAMGPMLTTLFRNKNKGMLGAQTIFYWRGIGTIQYWRSFEDLDQFARSKADPHLSAWQRYTKKVGASGSVGVWHETYVVDAGKYECVYANMPLFGLAAATEGVPAIGVKETARLRIKSNSES